MHSVSKAVEKSEVWRSEVEGSQKNHYRFPKIKLQNHISHVLSRWQSQSCFLSEEDQVFTCMTAASCPAKEIVLEKTTKVLKSLRSRPWKLFLLRYNHAGSTFQHVHHVPHGLLFELDCVEICDRDTLSVVQSVLKTLCSHLYSLSIWLSVNKEISTVCFWHY